MDRQLFKNSYPPTIWTRERHTSFIILSLILHSLLFIGLVFAPRVKEAPITSSKPVVVAITFYSEPAQPPSSPPKGSPSVPKSSPPVITKPGKEITEPPKSVIPIEAPSTLKPDQSKPADTSSSGPPSPTSPVPTVGTEVGKPGDKLKIVQGGIQITGGFVNPSGPLRPGGDVKDPQRINYVEPTYPQVAIIARIEGTVILEAVIGKDGKIKNVKVIQPLNPLLDSAAVEAIRQWRYTPSTLAGQPIEILLTVSVHFTIK